MGELEAGSSPSRLDSDRSLCQEDASLPFPRFPSLPLQPTHKHSIQGLALSMVSEAGPSDLSRRHDGPKPLDPAAMQQTRAPRDSPRRPRRQRRPIPIALSFFVVGLLASSICFVLAHRTPFPAARSYAHYAASSLSIIPKLADPGPSLDHHNPASFVSKILVERVAGSAEIKKVQQTILDVFRSPPLAADASKGRSGWHIEEHDTEASTPYGRKRFKNLIFTKDPHASRRLVIAAHYDSKYFAKGSFIGAIDSAAPCAMLVDLAYSLDSALEGIKGSKEDVTLQLLFFDGEEAFKVWTHTDSTYGSRALASNWSTTYHRPRRLTSDQAPIRKIDSMETLVLLDLLGAPDPSIPSYFTTTNWLFEELVASERRLSEAGLLYPSQDHATNKKSFFRSGFNILGGIEDDHLPFLANGVPILHLIPSPFPRVWHTLKDDATALDYPTNHAWAMIIRLFVSEFLQLDLNGVKPSEITARWAEMQQEQRRAEESWGEEENQPGRMGSWAAKGHVTSRSEEELASTIQ